VPSSSGSSAVAQVAAAAHHREVHAGAAALHAHGQDVDVLVAGRQAARVHRLLVQHPRQRLDLVAQLRRFLVLEGVGVGHHALLQRVQHLLLLAEQEALGVGHVALVVLRVHEADARRAAAADLVQQARPRAVGKDRVLASAQPEHLLDVVDGILHRPGARERAEVAVLLVHGAAVVGHARERPGHELQVRIALVVLEQDVELGVQRLDQVVLEQQRLGLAAHHRGFQP
jgi:hypothetical protein